MNKKCCVTIILFFLFISQCNFLFSQDSDRIFLPKKTMLKKGNWALTYELGRMFGYVSNNFEAYTFTIKKHISDNLAIRLSLGSTLTNIDRDTKYTNHYTYFDSTRSFNETSTYFDFQSSLNFQYYVNPNSKIKVFISLGPYAEYIYQKNSNFNFDLSEQWALGLFGSIGSELFLFDNVSIIGEYVLKGTYGKSKYKYDNPDFQNYRYDYVYKLNYNTARLGFSFYF